MKKLYEAELKVKQLKLHDTLKISIIYANSFSIAWLFISSSYFLFPLVVPYFLWITLVQRNTDPALISHMPALIYSIIVK